MGKAPQHIGEARTQLEQQLSTGPYTDGSADDPDVLIAQRLAATFGLAHERRDSDFSEVDDMDGFIRSYVALNDGMCSLEQLADHLDVRHAGPPSVKLNGIGGEMARGGTGLFVIAGSLWPFNLSRRFIDRVLATKINRSPGVTAQGANTTANVIGRVADRARRDGWATRQLPLAFYTSERIAHWGWSGSSRTKLTADLVSILNSRPFISAALAQTPSEHYRDALHRELLRHLAPEMEQFEFCKPWPSTSVPATLQAAGAAVHMVRERGSADGRSTDIARTLAGGTVHQNVLEVAPEELAVVYDLAKLREGARSGQLDGPGLRALTVAWAASNS